MAGDMDKPQTHRHKERLRKRRAGLAQLVEQLFCKHQVAGSNPATGTNNLQ